MKKSQVLGLVVAALVSGCSWAKENLPVKVSGSVAVSGPNNPNDQYSVVAVEIPVYPESGMASEPSTPLMNADPVMVSIWRATGKLESAESVARRANPTRLQEFYAVADPMMLAVETGELAGIQLRASRALGIVEEARGDGELWVSPELGGFIAAYKAKTPPDDALLPFTNETASTAEMAGALAVKVSDPGYARRAKDADIASRYRQERQKQ